MLYFHVCSELVNDDLLNRFLVLNHKHLMKITLPDIFCCRYVNPNQYLKKKTV